MPLFSVIIPVYNRYDQVKRAIDSVLSQTFTDYELIVVDDGSTDRTSEIESLYHGKLRFIKQPNLGVSAARNLGIKHSKSAHITFLDSDDEWNRRKLECHKYFINHNPRIRIHQCDDIWFRSGKRVNMSTRYTKMEGDIFTRSLELCAISPSSVSMASELFNEYGMFDEEMPACEDYDLWLRITPFENAGLINEKLITRYSGHNDQLSAVFQGMDRFRVYSILKLLDLCGDKLTDGQKHAAAECALKKILILKNGSDKRGNHKFSALLEQVKTAFMDGCCTRKYYQNLLQI